MLIGAQLPEYSHLFTHGEQRFFVTTDGRVGTAYRFPILDMESPQFDRDFDRIRQLLASLQPGVRLRWIHRCDRARSRPTDGARLEAIGELGWTQTNTVLVIEEEHAAKLPAWDLLRSLVDKRPQIQEKSADTILSAVDHALILELGGLLLSEAEMRQLFPELSAVLVSSDRGIDAGTEVIGLLRLWRQGSQEFGQDTLATLQEAMPAPFEVTVMVRKINEVRAQYILQRKRAQLETSSDSLALRNLADTENVAAETTLSGHGLVEIEWLVTLRRRTELTLRDDMALLSRILGRMGEVSIELQGAARSYAATQVGAEPHHTFLELDTIAPYFLPVFRRGEGPGIEPQPPRAVPFHRRDGSLYYFDLWRKGYDGANCAITGRRGKGKSVLANLISRALLADPAIRLIKVDVGGSYTKECELAGGEQIQFNLSEPSGLNPFLLLSATEYHEDASVILSGFLATLLLESRETVLSKEMLGSIEKVVLAYAESKPASPSLSDFLSRAPDLPRRTLLERFTEGGVFANVLKEIPGRPPLVENRYTYFNFERLQNAANEDFAQAVMAAVIASVNMEVLRAGDARRGAKSRVVFFADETPFFIQKNGRFFKLTTANFRKFGHATILIAQTTKDFELPKEDGTTDFGILINSPIRFFYQIDDEATTFAERFGLTERQLLTIQSLGRGEDHREVFLQDELGGRVLRVAVTKEEYWRVTSSRQDNEKLHALLKAVPGLTLKEGIRCLSLQ